MNEGDKYLNIKLPTGAAFDLIIKAIYDHKKEIDIVAFKNNDATNENKQPHFRVKGGGAVWVNTKKSQSEVKEESVI